MVRDQADFIAKND